jgi:hypothetical protein
MPDNSVDVTIRGRVEGLDNVEAALLRISHAIASMNQAYSPGSAYSTSGQSSLAPASSTPPPDPLSGTAPQSRTSGQVGVLSPPSFGYGTWGTGGGSPPPNPFGQSSSFYNNPYATNGAPMNVRIVGVNSPIPVSFSGGGGGNSGVNGVGAGGSANQWGAPPGAGAPPPPGGGGDQGVPLPGGVPVVGASFLGSVSKYLGPAAIVGAAAQISQGYINYTQPTFEANLAIRSRQIGGNYVSPMDAYAQRLVAANQGELALGGGSIGRNALIGAGTGAAIGSIVPGLGTVAGGIVGGLGAVGGSAYYALTRGRDLQTQNQIETARAERDMMLIRSYRLAGRSDTADQILGVYADGDQTLIDSENSWLERRTPDLDTLSTRLSVANMSAFRTGGTAAIRGALGNRDITNAVRQGYSQEDVSAAYGTFASAAQNPRMGDLRSRWLNGGPNVQSDIVQSFIANGDMEGLQNLNRTGILGKNFDTDLNAAFAQSQLGVNLQTAQSQYALGGTHVASTMLTGAGVTTVNAAQRLQASHLTDQLRIQQSQLAAIPESDVLGRTQKQSEIEQTSLQIRQSRAGRLETQYQYSTADIGVREARVKSGITRAELSGSPEQIYSARQQQIGVYQSEINRNTARINGGDLDYAQRRQLEYENISLMKQEYEARIQNNRELLSSTTQIAMFGSQVAKTQLSLATTINPTEGGMRSASSTMISSSATAMAAARSALANELRINPNSEKAAQAKSAYENAVAQYENDLLSPQSNPMPLSVQKNVGEASFLGNMFKSGFAIGADPRLAASMGMKGVQSEIQISNDRLKDERSKINSRTDLNAQQKQDLLAQADWNAEQQRMSYGQQASGFMNDLEYGWMGRMQSSIINNSPNSGWVNPNFSNRQASKYMQGVNGAWGFTGGPAGDAARVREMFQFPRISNSMVGMTGTSEGLLTTAASRFGAMPGTLQPPSLSLGNVTPIKLDIQLRWPDGKPAGKASVSATSNDLASGAASMIASPYRPQGQ